jgi:hypothetical protein
MKLEEQEGYAITRAALSVLRQNALQKIRDATVAIERYRDAQRAQIGLPFPLDDDDEFQKAFRDQHTKYFVGAPGEPCTACNGSGRKTT